MKNKEDKRLAEDKARTRNWKRWGPYLSERQWGTVREDYSANGDAWRYLPHEQAHQRAYRWGEDGLLGLSDRQCRLCLSFALWNGKDPILKERLFGLTNEQGNHGEDVKEVYYYLDGTPTASWLRGQYRYPQARFPYEDLIAESAKRGRKDPEYELADTGVLDDGHYFDVTATYAKAGDNDILMDLEIKNCGPEASELTILPTVWFRNRWSWEARHEGTTTRPTIEAAGNGFSLHEETLGDWSLNFEEEPDELVFTHNHTNQKALYKTANETPQVKDGFHDYVISGDEEAVSRESGTKAAGIYRWTLEPGETRCIHLRLRKGAPAIAYDAAVFAEREQEADAFYKSVLPPRMPAAQRLIARQAYAGLVWTKQFYHYIVPDWKTGDPVNPAPAATRNLDWDHLYARDIISMPDKWEYPWFAAWDLAFHMIPFARIDAAFAKDQLTLFLREWYLHPNGQMPAYEWNFGDVNPPVHAWGCWRVYQIAAENGDTDRTFLASSFQKLLLNFTWWVNRKDENGNHLFSGGFLGLDNIGVFDRSRPLPNGAQLQQADGTAWMGFYCLIMLAMALELAIDGDEVDPAYADMASKFFEHFIQICDAMNQLGGSGLWDEEDGFYYDKILDGEATKTFKIRSMVGLLPLIAVGTIQQKQLERLPGFNKRFRWFLANRPDLARHIVARETPEGTSWLLALPGQDRLKRIVEVMLDEDEFLSPFGVRGLSKAHGESPFSIEFGGEVHTVGYTPGESDSPMFGGNSNWRGPVWFPVNYLLAEAMEAYDAFYGDEIMVALPTGSTNKVRLKRAGQEIHWRLSQLFLPDQDGHRPCHGGDPHYAATGPDRDRILFYEYFHGDSGEGLGASHQTGWTALVATCLEKLN